MIYIFFSFILILNIALGSAKAMDIVEEEKFPSVDAKITGLARGWYYTHYEYPGSSENRTMRCKYDPIAAKQLNELLIEKGDSEAIQRKIEGLKRGGDPVYQISKDHQFSSYAVEMEMKHARYPTYGYEKDALELERFMRVLKERE